MLAHLRQSVPVWVGWLIGAMLWIGVALGWYVRTAPNHMQSVWMWLSLLGAAIYAARGIYAFARKEKHQKERELSEEPDFGQLVIFGAVAAVVLASIPLGFWALTIVGEMQR